MVWLCLVSLYCEMQNYSMTAQLDIPVWQHLQGYCTFWHPKLNPGQKTPVPWPQPTSHLINGNTKTDVKHNCYPLFLFIKIFPLPSCFCKSLWCGRVCFWQPVRGNFSFQDWIFEQIPSWSRFSHLSFLFFYVPWQYRGTSLAPPCQITLSFLVKVSFYSPLLPDAHTIFGLLGLVSIFAQYLPYCMKWLEITVVKKQYIQINDSKLKLSKL